MIEDLNILMQDCSECSLSRSRENVITGSGNEKSEVIFVSDAPTGEEDESDQVPNGQAGEPLKSLLDIAGLSLDSIFMTHLVKCRPLYDREPLPSEVNMCAARWLDKQLKIIQPKLIITSGKYATNKLLPGARQLSAIHGRLFKKGLYYIFPTHSLNFFIEESRLKREMEEDFEKLKEVLKHLEIKF